MQIGAENVGANYAIALVELASEADDLEKVHQDMDALASILSENAEVTSLSHCAMSFSSENASKGTRIANAECMSPNTEG